ncbi:MAG: hypothetical protein ACOYI4_07000 [Christensenellales bacterium]|jgi:DNA-binding NarL/FixJ family response regulator
MKKIGFITTNKVLAQSLAAAVGSDLDLRLETFLMLNLHQAALDAELARIDIAVVDVMDVKETETVLTICKKLRQTVPDCRLLLLVSQDNKKGRKMAIDAIKSGVAHDFVFYDMSLEYLFAKLAAF